MSLVVDRRLPTADPQTHLLLIAVNDYPHLNGGSGTPAPQTYGQGQLTTPVPSAVKIANWFDTRLNNATTPLGTIEMVASPGATLPSIAGAFSAWFNRCANNPQNVACFYFCGHGLESKNNVTALLAEDYGANPLDPWAGAFDFRAMFLNLADWSCNSQIFLLDACRTTIPDSLNGLSALKSATPTSFPPRDAPVFKATSFGNAALGPANAPSYFSEALVDCLEMLGVSHFDGSAWVVDTASLGRALVQRMYRTIDGGLRRFLPCDIGGGVQSLSSFTHVHSVAPVDVRVMSEFYCDPTAAEDDATLVAYEPSLAYQIDSAGELRPWRPNLPLGDYDLSGRLVAGSAFSSIAALRAARAAPPIFMRKLRAV